MLPVFVGLLCATSPAQSPTNAGRAVDLPRRIIHVFDFNERERGNLEDIPMYWTPIRQPGFPHFARGRIDERIGNDAPPSFNLCASGRNVGYRYAGPHTPVRFANVYRVTARIRPRQLIHARACVEACYLDSHGRMLPGTTRRSSLVADPARIPAEQDVADEAARSLPWTEVVVDLPAAPESAATVGIAVMVLQRSVWDLSSRPVGFIEFADVHAEAWFDDITVYALPRIEVESSAPTGIFTLHRTGQLAFRVTSDDIGDSDLNLKLEVVSDDGRVVVEKSGTRSPETSIGEVGMDPTKLEPGLYEARLRIIEGESSVVGKVIAFAVMPALRSGGVVPASQLFGIVLDMQPEQDAAVISTILSHIGGRGVKVRLNPDSANTAGHGDEASTSASTSALRGLARERVTLTGVLPQQPFAALRDAGWGSEGKVQAELTAGDVLRLRTADWIASNASLVHVFQIGADHEPVVPLDASYAELLARLRQELMRYSSNLRLAVPCPLSSPPTVASLQGLRLSVVWPAGTEVEQGDDRIAALRRLQPDGIDVFVGDDPGRGNETAENLANWARSIISALHAQVDTIYVDSVWSERTEDPSASPRLSRRALVLRALADLLGDARPGPVLRLSETARGVVFLRDQTAVMACWDTGSGASVPAVMQLGGAPRILDLWGRPGELSADDRGRRVLSLSPMPVLIDNIPAWVFQFQQSLAIKPRLLPFSLEPQVRTLSLMNPSTTSLSGEAWIVAPSGWEVRPPRMRLEIPAGATVELPIEFRYPSNESAGVKPLTLNVTVDGDPPLMFESRVELEIGLPDVEVSATAVIEGNRLLIHQMIRNQSDRTLSFRGFAGLPGQPRQYHQIDRLAPGESRVETYQFFNVGGLSGQIVRVGLREMDGSRMHNLDVKIP